MERIKRVGNIIRKSERKSSYTIGIAGVGQFGTALSTVLYKKAKIIGWDGDEAKLDNINKTRRNKLFKTEAEIPEEIQYTKDIRQLAEASDILVFAIPSDQMI